MPAVDAQSFGKAQAPALSPRKGGQEGRLLRPPMSNNLAP